MLINSEYYSVEFVRRKYWLLFQIDVIIVLYVHTMLRISLFCARQWLPFLMETSRTLGDCEGYTILIFSNAYVYISMSVFLHCIWRSYFLIWRLMEKINMSVTKVSRLISSAPQFRLFTQCIRFWQWCFVFLCLRSLFLGEGEFECDIVRIRRTDKWERKECQIDFLLGGKKCSSSRRMFTAYIISSLSSVAPVCIFLFLPQIRQRNTASSALPE